MDFPILDADEKSTLQIAFKLHPIFVTVIPRHMTLKHQQALEAEKKAMANEKAMLGTVNGVDASATVAETPPTAAITTTNTVTAMVPAPLVIQTIVDPLTGQ